MHNTPETQAKLLTNFIKLVCEDQEKAGLLDKFVDSLLNRHTNET